MDDTIQVLVVSDDPLARSGLAALVETQGLAVTSSLSVADTARKTFAPAQPDVAAWDLRPDVPAHLDGLKDLDEAQVPVLALITDESAAQEALASGARGVLFRDAPGLRLGTALRALAQGNLILDESLIALIRPRLQPAAPLEALTARETEVLEQLALGLSNKEIAQRLGMSEHTAKFHVNSILGKLGAQSRTEAVVRAARLGLLTL